MSDKQTPPQVPLRIDIISDVVCPWCAVGYYQLARALEESEIDAEIHWHPFQLNPHLPEGGRDYRQHISEKYGMSMDQIAQNRAKITALGAEVGFEFNYADDMHTYASLRAHQLIHWAAEQGRDHDMKLELLAAMFTRREAMDDVATLAACAGNIGLNEDDARAVLEEKRFEEDVLAEINLWASRGVSGVPSMVFDEKYLTSGAYGVDGFKEMLSRLNAERAA